MSRSTISTFQLFKLFPDAETARKYIETRLWKDGVKCPTCNSGERITARKEGFYRCNAWDAHHGLLISAQEIMDRYGQ